MIFIAGLSGQLSSRVARLLAERSIRFKGSSRNPDKALGLAPAVEVVNASYEDPAALTAALHGVERFLLVSTSDHDEGKRQALHRAAIQAAKDAGVRHVVYTSFLSVNPTSPFSAGATHAATEAALRDSGMTYTFLRASLYADFLPAVLGPAVASGLLAVPAGNGAASYVTRDDLAEVAAQVLADGGFENETLEVTGPAAVTQAELAELAGRITGRPVRYQDVSEDEFAETMARLTGAPISAARGLGGLYAAIRNGEFERVGDGVPRVTGHAATSVESVLRANAAQLTAPPVGG